MKQKTQKIFFVSTFLLASSGAVFAYLPAKTDVCKSDVKGFCAYTSSRELSGKNDTTSRAFAAGETSFVVPGIEFLQIPGNADLGDVLVQLYKYLLGLVGISALLMLIWGGFEYATATDKGVSDAKKKIGNAFFGLALALISYLGLLTINPDFVKKLNLTLEPITLGTPGTGTKELCIRGAGCTDITGRCSGVQVCNADGTVSECKKDAFCTGQVNTATCFGAAHCGNATPGVNISFKKDFNSPDICNQNCTADKIVNYIKQVCNTSETFDIIDVGCGTQ